jgi:hypothetical protein
MKLRAHPALMVLTTMLLIGSLAVLIVVMVVVSGIDQLQQGLNDTKYNETFVAASACIEEAMFRLNADGSYAGGAFTIGDVECTATVTNLGGTDRLVNVEATTNILEYVSRLEVTVDLSTSPMTIVNWEEVDN